MMKKMTKKIGYLLFPIIMIIISSCICHVNSFLLHKYLFIIYLVMISLFVYKIKSINLVLEDIYFYRLHILLNIISIYIFFLYKLFIINIIIMLFNFIILIILINKIIKITKFNIFYILYLIWFIYLIVFNILVI